MDMLLNKKTKPASPTLYTHTHTYIYKVKLTAIVEDDQKAPIS